MFDTMEGRSRKAAAMAVTAVVVFSIAFIGLVTLLDNVAVEAQDSNVVISDASPVEPFYVLLIGSDSRKGTALYTGKKSDHAQVDQHSDIMTLVRVDPLEYTITLVSIPRDTVLGGTGMKVNDALLGGDPTKVVAVSEELTGVSIDYYFMTDFTSFEQLINAINGVIVNVPRDIMVPDPMTVEEVQLVAGENQHLNGSEALVLARARKEYGENQEALRQNNVRNIELAIIEKVLSFDNKQANKALLVLGETTVTNIDIGMVSHLLIDFSLHKDEVVIYSSTGPYLGGVNEDGLWVVEEDPIAWADLMAVVDAGGDPVSVIAPPVFN